MPQDLHQVLRSLSATRPLFHSEADFQHALAWAYREHSPSAEIRLECRIPLKDERAYADLWIREEGFTTYIELKYWTRFLDLEHEGEVFSLANQAAQPLSRYDFIKDLARVERAVDSGLAHRGFVVALTNNPGYRNTQLQSPIDAAFRLTEGRSLTGTLAWEKHAGTGTIKNREKDLHLAGEYLCRWEPYSKLGGAPGDFRYLLIAVNKV